MSGITKGFVAIKLRMVGGKTNSNCLEALTVSYPKRLEMANAIAALCYAFIMYHFECLAIACCVFFLQFHLSTHRFQWVSMDQYFLLILAMSVFQDLWGSI